jgi:hypothetical protein
VARAEKMMPLPAELSHWTKEGTFRITPKLLAGSLFCELWFKEINLGPYHLPKTAAKSILDGKHDQELGFKASALGVPLDPDKWNGLR